MKDIGKPIVIGTSSQIEYKGLFQQMKSGSVKPIIPKYSKMDLEDLFEKVFYGYNLPERLSGKRILRSSRGYLKDIEKIFKI